MTVGPWPVNTVVGAFLLAFPTLFSIINPVGSSLVFYNVTSDRTHHERAVLARRVGVYSLAILLGSILLGGYVLTFFGVSLGALRIGGGLVVSVQAWNLLLAPEAQETRKLGEAAPATERDDIAFFPLTMPLTVGPGTISVAITLGNKGAAAHELLPLGIGALAATLVVAAAIYVCYRFAERVLRLLGESGTDIFLRLSAFVLLCLGVQILTNGLGALPWLTRG